MLLFWMLALGADEGGLCPKADSPLHQSGARAFIDGGGGYITKTVQLALTVILRLGKW